MSSRFQVLSDALLGHREGRRGGCICGAKQWFPEHFASVLDAAGVLRDLQKLDELQSILSEFRCEENGRLADYMALHSSIEAVMGVEVESGKGAATSGDV